MIPHEQGPGRHPCLPRLRRLDRQRPAPARPRRHGAPLRRPRPGLGEGPPQADVELPDQLGADRTASAARRATDATLEVHAAIRPDVVVVIRGDLFEPRFWDRLEESGRPFVVWLYDEVRRMSHDVATLARATAVTSYSPLDVQWLRDQGIDAHHLPNAFDRDRQVVRPMVRRDEISFVGARYPDREQTLVGLHEAGVPVRAYGRDWSRHPADRLRTWGWHRPGVPAERDVDRDTAYAVMAGVGGHAQHAHRPGRLRDAHLRGVRLRRRPADRPPRPGRALRRRRRGRHAGRRSRSCSSSASRARVDLDLGAGAARRRGAGARSPSTPSTTGSPVVEQLWG